MLVLVVMMRKLLRYVSREVLLFGSVMIGKRLLAVLNLLCLVYRLIMTVAITLALIALYGLWLVDMLLQLK